MLFMACVFDAFASVHCCLVITCCERADLLALVCDDCVFVTFPCGILSQVWYLIVSIPDLCRLFYFEVIFILVLSIVSSVIFLQTVWTEVRSDKLRGLDQNPKLTL